MFPFLTSLAEVTLTMSVVIALLLILTPLLAKRFSPRWRYWAWLVIALRLLVPFNLSLPSAPISLAVPEALQTDGAPLPSLPPSSVSGGALSEAPDLDASAPPVVSGAQRETFPPREQPLTVTQDDVATSRQTWQAIPWPNLIFFLWVLGGAVFLLRQAGGHLSFLRLARRWRTPASPEAQEELARQRVRLGMRRPVALYTCPAVDTPLLTGLLHPVILLPPELADSALPAVLAHELTHLRRRDLWYKLLLLLARAVHWFNPLVWLMCRRAEGDLEQCCDYDLLKGSDLAARQAYGQVILSQITAARQPSRHLTTGFSGGRREVFRRFRALLDGTVKRPGRAALALTAAVTLLSGGLVACGGDQEGDAFACSYTGLPDGSGVLLCEPYDFGLSMSNDFFHSLEVEREERDGGFEVSFYSKEMIGLLGREAAMDYPILRVTDLLEEDHSLTAFGQTGGVAAALETGGMEPAEAQALSDSLFLQASHAIDTLFSISQAQSGLAVGDSYDGLTYTSGLWGFTMTIPGHAMEAITVRQNGGDLQFCYQPLEKRDDSFPIATLSHTQSQTLFEEGLAASGAYPLSYNSQGQAAAIDGWWYSYLLHPLSSYQQALSPEDLSRCTDVMASLRQALSTFSLGQESPYASYSGELTAYLEWADENSLTLDPVRLAGDPPTAVYNDLTEQVILPFADGLAIDGQTPLHWIFTRAISSSTASLPPYLFRFTIQEGVVTGAQPMDASGAATYPFTGEFLARVQSVSPSLMAIDRYELLSVSSLPGLSQDSALPLSEDCVYSVVLSQAPYGDPIWTSESLSDFASHWRLASEGMVCMVQMKNGLVTSITESSAQAAPPAADFTAAHSEFWAILYPGDPSDPLDGCQMVSPASLSDPGAVSFAEDCAYYLIASYSHQTGTPHWSAVPRDVFDTRRQLSVSAGMLCFGYVENGHVICLMECAQAAFPAYVTSLDSGQVACFPLNYWFLQRGLDPRSAEGQAAFRSEYQSQWEAGSPSQPSVRLTPAEDCVCTAVTDGEATPISLDLFSGTHVGSLAYLTLTRDGTFSHVELLGVDLAGAGFAFDA